MTEETYYCGLCRKPMPLAHFPHGDEYPAQWDEPLPYTRADAESDLANAEYYDEIAQEQTEFNSASESDEPILVPCKYCIPGTHHYAGQECPNHPKFHRLRPV